MKLRIKEPINVDETFSEFKDRIIDSVDKNMDVFSYYYTSSLNDFNLCDVICIESKDGVDELLVHLYIDKSRVLHVGFQNGDKIKHPCWFTYDSDVTFSSNDSDSCSWIVDKLSLLSGLFKWLLG